MRIRAKLLGTEDHPNVAAPLHNLAIVLQDQGDLTGARDHLERVLRIEERIYGTPDHLSSAVTEESLQRPKRGAYRLAKTRTRNYILPCSTIQIDSRVAESLLYQLPFISCGNSGGLLVVCASL